MSARRENGRIVVLVPAHLSAADEQRHVAALVARIQRREATAVADEGESLDERARRLSERYLDGRAVPTSVRWVSNQNSRWGSCSTGEGTIRLSHRLRTMPDWVIDAVLVHELAHLIEANHGPRFQALVQRYPRTERARGFLEGVQHTT